MTGYTFAGQHFATIAEWKLAYPPYRAYSDLLKAGNATVMDMEKAIRARQDKGRANSLKAARSGAHSSARSIRFDGKAR